MLSRGKKTEDIGNPPDAVCTFRSAAILHTVYHPAACNF